MKKFIKENPEVLLLAFFATVLSLAWYDLHLAWDAWERTGLK